MTDLLPNLDEIPVYGGHPMHPDLVEPTPLEIVADLSQADRQLRVTRLMLLRKSGPLCSSCDDRSVQ